MGRWSRLIATDFLAWLQLPPDLHWADVGCGTGALSARILERAAPQCVRAYDLSLQYIAAARERLPDPRAEFIQADALSLPEPAGAFDVAVSGLMANFVPDPARLVAEMGRVVRPGAPVAIYVWDYAERMQFIRTFWDAAMRLDPAAAKLDEAFRFPLCRPDQLRRLFEQAGLAGIEVRSLEVSTRFESFNDYWEPFEGGQGPAPGYLVSLDQDRRAKLRAEVASRLSRAADGSISLIARAWGVRGVAT
jgi:SAM-dependent methyltransferase